MENETEILDYLVEYVRKGYDVFGGDRTTKVHHPLEVETEASKLKKAQRDAQSSNKGKPKGKTPLSENKGDKSVGRQRAGARESRGIDKFDN